ncbi:MAG: hypothetical protein R3F61_34000 [Myxococcota bacterium]
MGEKQKKPAYEKEIERWEAACGVEQPTTANSEILERTNQCTDEDPYVMREYFQQPVPGKSGQYSSFTVFDCGGDVAVELPFKPDRGLDDGVQEDWSQGIKEAWDGAFELEDPDGSRKAVRVMPTFDANTRDPYYNPVRSTDASGGDMNHWPVEDGKRTKQEVAAHEAGHFLLAPDTYDLYGADPFSWLVGRPPTAAERDGGRDADGNLRYDESNSIMSDYGAVRASQFEQMHSKIKATRGIDSTLHESTQKTTPNE